eukprot:tig00000190_g13844.t1
MRPSRNGELSKDDSFEVLRLLLAGGADLAAAGLAGRSPLGALAELDGGQPEAERAARLLREVGAKLPRSEATARAMLRAAQKCNAAFLRFAFEQGLDPRLSWLDPAARAKYPLACTATASSYRVDALRAILDAGGDPNEAGDGGQRPLHESLRWRGEGAALPEGAALLLERGADIEGRDGAGATPLLACLPFCSEESNPAEALLLRGADPSARDASGRAAAVVAAGSGAVAGLRSLLRRGAGRFAGPGELAAAAAQVRGRGGSGARRAALEEEVRSDAECEGAPPAGAAPVLERGPGGSLVGRSGAFLAAAVVAIRDEDSERDAGPALQWPSEESAWLDLLLMCSGRFREADLAPLRAAAADAADAARRLRAVTGGGGGGGGAAPGAALAQAERLLRAEARLELEPDSRESAAAASPAAAIAAAIAGGLRRNALRLARTAEPVDGRDGEGYTPLYHAVLAGPPPSTSASPSSSAARPPLPLPLAFRLLRRQRSGADVGARVGARARRPAPRAAPAGASWTPHATPPSVRRRIRRALRPAVLLKRKSAQIQ